MLERIGKHTAVLVSAVWLSACANPSEATSDAAPGSETPAVSIDPLAAVAPELRASATSFETVTFSEETLMPIRAVIAERTPPLPEGIVKREIPGPEGAPDVTVLIVDPAPDTTNKPAYLHIHGGGYIIGSAAERPERLFGIASDCDCVVVSVDYRLAPETPFPGPMEDNFAALTWLRDNAEELGVDADRIAIGGESAGGGHSAQLAIAARDRGVPIVFQVLIYPMLDDRTGSTRSVPDHIGHYVWNAASNRFAWTSYLGQPAGSDNPPYGAVPARVKDLSGLAPAWIGTGSVDLFMAEDLEYARRLIEAGTPVEVLVTPGGYHAFDGIGVGTEAAEHFTKSWRRALRKALHPTSE